MNHRKVFADFHNADARGRLRLNCIGTVEDLAQQQIVLRSGLPLTLYSEELEVEAAVASQSHYIITHNLRDFTGSGIEGYFGIEPIRPREFFHRFRSREL